jgi:hypothetical protein
MRNIKAIFIKQLTSQLRNPVMLAQAFVFIIMLLVFSFFLNDTDTCESCIPAYVCGECLEKAIEKPDPTMIGLFTVMFAGLSLIGASSGLVLEDKTTHNLRFMTMSGVKPHQYLAGTLPSIFVLAFAVIVIFSMLGGHFGIEMLRFVSVSLAGAVVSILFGVAMGLSKYPIIATPVSFVIGFGPMLSNFNDNLARYLRFLYNQQVNLALSDLNRDLTSNFTIIGINGLVVLAYFVWLHRKGELRW